MGGQGKGGIRGERKVEQIVLHQKYNSSLLKQFCSGYPKGIRENLLLRLRPTRKLLPKFMTISQGRTDRQEKDRERERDARGGGGADNSALRIEWPMSNECTLGSLLLVRSQKSSFDKAPRSPRSEHDSPSPLHTSGLSVKNFAPAILRVFGLKGYYDLDLQLSSGRSRDQSCKPRLWNSITEACNFHSQMSKQTPESITVSCNSGIHNRIMQLWIP